MKFGADKEVPKLWVPHKYQQEGIKFLHERTSLNPEGKGGAGLLWDCGLGKSTTCLEWMLQMKEYGLANRFLIVAPLRVVTNVWPREIVEWSNFRSLSYSVVHGSAQVRRKRLATQVNIHIINREGIPWLTKQLEGRKVLPWQAIIVDESTSFKTWSAARSKALRKLIPRIPYRVILTGTPTPNTLADLYPQAWLLDEGAALGENITQFRSNNCCQVGERQMNKFEVRKDREAVIHDAVKHMVLRLDAKDHLDMPELVYNTIHCDLPTKAMAEYKSMEEQLFVALADGSSRGAVNAGAKYNACRQIANGGIYDEQHNGHHLHDAKVDALQELIDELQGKPVLIAYQFGHDLERIRKRFPHIQAICGGMKTAEVDRLIADWNGGCLKGTHLAVQPQALSHGVNLQSGPGRHIYWMGPSDNLDTVYQFDRRIYRQGVGSTVVVHRASCNDTLDELIWQKINNKEEVQSSLLEVLRQYAKLKMSKRSV